MSERTCSRSLRGQVLSAHAGSYQCVAFLMTLVEEGHMTFRIDHAARNPDGVWIFGIKGISGIGIYGMLHTGGAGRQLYLLPPSGLPANSRLLKADFEIETDSVAKAVEMLASALTQLGWGPCVSGQCISSR